jgi:hypothetical protein
LYGRAAYFVGHCQPYIGQGRRRLGLNEFACKKSCVALISNATTSDEARNNNVGLDADMGLKCERSQPTISRCHTRKFRISAVFCDGFGVCGRTRAHGMQACLQKKSIKYFVPHYGKGLSLWKRFILYGKGL